MTINSDPKTHPQPGDRIYITTSHGTTIATVQKRLKVQGQPHVGITLGNNKIKVPITQCSYVPQKYDRVVLLLAPYEQWMRDRISAAEREDSHDAYELLEQLDKLRYHLEPWMREVLEVQSIWSDSIAVCKLGKRIIRLPLNAIAVYEKYRESSTSNQGIDGAAKAAA